MGSGGASSRACNKGTLIDRLFNVAALGFTDLLIRCSF